MANEYTLSNTAANIDSAITRVVGADTEPTAGSQNMVTSGGVKAAFDNIVGDSSGSGSITTDSFTNESLNTSSSGLAQVDTAVPTSLTVHNAIETALAVSTPNNRTFIKILPTDFIGAANILSVDGKKAGELNVRYTNAYASYDIPLGYVATKGTGWGNCHMQFYTGAINTETMTSLGDSLDLGTQSGLTGTITFSNPVASTALNYIIIEARKANSSTDHEFRGGYITLVKV